ncbi:hypothetical protein WJX72_012542 [[Myrmecia] bisecta]|uniref:Protein YIP n=1 Tax=[Myrmecia] bisecta TaxID=41462 RepID=A0AAW1QTU1_9CHLO
MAFNNKPSGSAFSEDVERLFQSEVPAVPVSTNFAQPNSPGSAGNYSPTAPGHSQPLNTLDEPVWDTVKRDLRRIYANLVLVVFPFKNRDQQSAALRNWDLWGPMAFTLTLAICLSIGAPKPSSVFSLVFGTLSAGAVILTVNVVLLGGNIGFFQSMCLLGYCIFPLDVAAIISLAVKTMLVRWIVVGIALAWSSWASVPFIGGSVSPARKALAVYPLLLLYTCMAWLALIKG